MHDEVQQNLMDRCKSSDLHQNSFPRQAEHSIWLAGCGTSNVVYSVYY